MTDLAMRLRASPGLFPHSYDPLAAAILLIEMDRAAYEAASFLDGRMLGPQTKGRWVPAPLVVAAMQDAPPPDCRFIFHIGHVGSTLLARMLGAVPGVLALREPAALRTFAEMAAGLAEPESPVAPSDHDARLNAVLKLYSRRYAAGDAVAVKATSFVSEVAGDLLTRTGGLGIAMTAPAESYIAGILGGEASRAEIRAKGQDRLRRLHRRLGAAPWRLAAMGEGECVAMGWLCEVTALIAADRGRLLWIDFERFLGDPVSGLAQACAQFGIAADATTVAGIVTGPLMTRYSKAPEHAYSANLRRQVLDGARADFGADIAAGLKWLEAAAKDWPVAAAAIERAGL